MRVRRGLAAALSTAVLTLAASGCSHAEPKAMRGQAFVGVLVSPSASPPPSPAPEASGDPREAGFRVFARTCVTCHQPSGMGMPNAFPPLAGSDFLAADKGRSVRIVLGGIEGAITVNGKPYAATMPSFAALTDEEIADVLTFVASSWGNQGEAVSREEVAERRAQGTAPVTLTATR